MSKTTLLPDGSAFATATIMSKEEAMALPVEKRPICFRISPEMYNAVFEIAIDLFFKIDEEKE